MATAKTIRRLNRKLSEACNAMQNLDAGRVDVLFADGDTKEFVRAHIKAEIMQLMRAAACRSAVRAAGGRQLADPNQRRTVRQALNNLRGHAGERFRFGRSNVAVGQQGEVNGALMHHGRSDNARCSKSATPRTFSLAYSRVL